MRRRELMYRRGADVRTRLLHVHQTQTGTGNLTCDRLVTNDWRSQCSISSILVIRSESRERGSKQKICLGLVQLVYFAGASLELSLTAKILARSFPVQEYDRSLLRTLASVGAIEAQALNTVCRLQGLIVFMLQEIWSSYHKSVLFLQSWGTEIVRIELCFSYVRLCDYLKAGNLRWVVHNPWKHKLEC